MGIFSAGVHPHEMRHPSFDVGVNVFDADLHTAHTSAEERTARSRQAGFLHSCFSSIHTFGTILFLRSAHQHNVLCESS